MGDARKTEASLLSALTALMSESEFSSVDYFNGFLKFIIIYLFINGARCNTASFIHVNTAGATRRPGSAVHEHPSSSHDPICINKSNRRSLETARRC